MKTIRSGVAPGRATLAVLAAAVLAVAGCGADEEAAGGTAAVSADLLSSRAGGGGAATTREAPAGGASGSRPAAPGSPAPREVDVRTLGFDAGDPEALVQIMEFSDFGCGYCRKFHLETWPTLEEQYIRTGKVRWKYVPMILGMFGPNAEVAAVAAECAIEQGRFPAVRDRLFEDQGAWKRAGNARAVLRDLVTEEGVEPARWEACMDDGGRAERVAQGTALSRELGVRGTPTFFIMGYGSIPGAIPLELFQQVLDGVYDEASRAAGSGG